MLWVRISFRARWTTLCDQVCQWLATGRWFSLGPPVSSTNKSDHHDIYLSVTGCPHEVSLRKYGRTHTGQSPLCKISAQGQPAATHTGLSPLDNKAAWGQPVTLRYISWWSDLLVEETGGPRENHRPVASHWQTWSHNVGDSGINICRHELLTRDREKSHIFTVSPTLAGMDC
jgi:hypothetical protein